MEKCDSLIYDLETGDQNWIVDSPLSDKNKDMISLCFIENSIHTVIEYRKTILESLETQIPDDIKSGNDQIDPSTNFNLPEFLSPKPRYIKNYMTKSQRWIGHIIDISDQTFNAKLSDQVNPGTYEIASFEFSEIAREDFPFIQIGAVFYWSVGYAYNNGQIIKQSLVRFQRLSPWSMSDFDESSDRAHLLFKGLKMDT